jgi:hypothetical protein
MLAGAEVQRQPSQIIDRVLAGHANKPGKTIGTVDPAPSITGARPQQI